jgi:hypothetical protein
MKTFLLFVYSDFDDREDIEFFCLDILGNTSSINKVRYVIEGSTNNIIVIFESDLERKELANNLKDSIPTDIVKFYFLFERESIYSANLPVQLRDFMFKIEEEEHTSLLLEYEKKPKKLSTTKELDLDVILEKIKHFGVESLTSVEKKFLDNFNI